MPLNAGKASRKSGEKKIIVLDKQAEDKLPVEVPDPEDIIFALDIGTRTVVGIAGIQEKDAFRVIAAEVIEHKSRAMLDGQIHDIYQVAEVAREVKEKLESKIGVTLTKVSIAAAGRVLKTCEVKLEREVDPGREIDHDTVGRLEMEGIQLAQMKLDEEMPKDDKTQFYCVGYSVINYYLNGYVISTILGHKGRKVGVEILATFLPHIVVDSLYTVMGKIGLEVTSLTLEPIAAINVTIPKDLRLLNLALVDIGAGTSDIAITRDGSVVAYAMAPVAGDEITEKVAQHYLVDFNTGEKIKISLSSKKEEVKFADILGKKHSIRKEDIIEVIKPTVEILAETIAQKILEFNHKAPNAVFLIGGGSQIPGLTDMVAGFLQLPKDRVVVRGRDIIQNVKFSGRILAGPESITPFGIAVTALMQKGQDFMAVTVNGKKVRLFNSKKLTVADALILVGFDPGQLIGRTGKSVTFELNGARKVVKGEYGKAAEIFVNEIPASLDTILAIGDNIRVNPSENGRNASIKAQDLVKKPHKGKVTLNGSVIDLETKVYINGKMVGPDTEIHDGDAVEAGEIITLGDLARHYEIDNSGFDFYVNDEKAAYDYVLKNNDSIECRKKAVTIEETPEDEEVHTDSGKAAGEVENDITSPGVSEEGIPDKNALFVIVNGKHIALKGEKSQYIFVDIFNYIDFDLTKPQGNIVLRLNGKPAAFTDVVGPGDVIDIYWAK